jgi:hypothetical protein
MRPLLTFAVLSSRIVQFSEDSSRVRPYADTPRPRWLWLRLRRAKSLRLGVRSLSVCRLGVNSPFASTRARRLLGRLIVEGNNEHRTLCPLEYSVGDTARKQMIKRPAPV